METTKSSSKEILADAIRRRCAVLFVGAGVSMAVGLPSWQTLVDHLLKELELDADVIDGMSNGYQMLAEFYRLKQGGIGPLRSWLDRNWKVACDRVMTSQVHKLSPLSDHCRKPAVVAAAKSNGLVGYRTDKWKARLLIAMGGVGCHSACNIGSDSLLMQFEGCLAF